MKKLLFILMIISTSALAQGEKKDSIVASNGVTYKVGDDVVLGLGSGINGSYVYIYTAPGIVESIKLPSGWSDYKMRIRSIRQMGTKKRGYKTILVLAGGNIVNYWMELEAAIRTGELQTIKLTE
jgi:hypothetical protein